MKYATVFLFFLPPSLVAHKKQTLKSSGKTCAEPLFMRLRTTAPYAEPQ
jgi:hypothetical protein